MRFCANIQLKLHKFEITPKKRHISTIFVDFEGFYASHPILAEY